MKLTGFEGDGGEGLYVRRRSRERDMEQGKDSAWSKSQVSGSGADGYDNVDVMMAMSVEELLDWIMDSGSSYYITYRRDYVVDFKEYDGGNILLGDGRECRVRGTCKVQVQMRDGSSFVLDNVRYVLELRRNLISLGTLEKEGFTMKMQSGKIKVIKGSLVVLSGTRRGNCVYTPDGQAVTRKTLKGRKQLREYQTGWKIKKGNALDFCNHRSTQQCTKSGVSKHLSFAGLQQQNGLVEETNVTLLAKVCCVLIQSGLSKVLWAEDTTMSTYLVNKAHKSLTFNNTVACEVISKWKAGLKDNMDARSNVYVLSNGCRKCSNDSDVYYWEYTSVMFIHLFLYIDDIVFSYGCKAEIWPTKGLLDKAKGNVLGMEIMMDQSEDCDVGKNSKWSCIYAVGSQEYHVVCTRPDIASADVGMLDGFDRGLQTYVQVFVDFDYAMAMMLHMMALLTTEAGYMTFTEAAKEATGLKGLVIESGFELKIVACIATGAFSKAIPSLRF
ncbi:zinc finger, CCHC-type containing protein [Tanacetum coccineum]